MKPNQLQLAKHLVAELEVFAEVQLDVPGISDPWISGMLHRGIPFTPSFWAGDRIPQRKMRLVRAAEQLERLELLKRVTEPNRDRTTHVIPSTKLIVDTIDQLGNQVDLNAVVAGLSRTAWGRGIADQLLQTRSDTASVDL
ncbi:hypothetical protein SH528x_000227 [Novipirellula sp. SH528]|uniref:hypothetical protein n=1 Tax=Novipirellula sp. SH528 TaxID=3454466 RepID=UPI003C9F293E